MLFLHFDPFPELNTERLLLRKTLTDDSGSTLKIRGNEVAMRYIPRPQTKTVEDAIAHINNLTKGIQEQQQINWAICLNTAPAIVMGFIGFVNLYPETMSAEIGYMLHPDYWGKGYIPEALAAVEQYGFREMGLQTIEAKIDPRNENSRKVLVRSGYLFNRLEEKSMVFEEEAIDSAFYIKTFNN